MTAKTKTKSKTTKRGFAKFPRTHSRSVLFLDTSMLVVGVVGPLTGLGQAIQIFTSQSSGSVSLLSWGMFVVFNAITLTYGIVHRLIPVIIPNLAWVIVDMAVVVGIVMYP